MRFTIDDAQRAADKWNFNCGPGALCAVLDKTPDEMRPHLLDFEAKGYTNPTLMYDILNTMGVQYTVPFRSATERLTALDESTGRLRIIPSGAILMRVQWSGPWCKPGVPMAARYRHTHWVALRGGGVDVFDVNAMCVGGWLPYAEWATRLVPWLMRECCPKSDGKWWPTHVIAIQKGAQP